MPGSNKGVGSEEKSNEYNEWAKRDGQSGSVCCIGLFDYTISLSLFSPTADPQSTCKAWWLCRCRSWRAR